METKPWILDSTCHPVTPELPTWHKTQPQKVCWIQQKYWEVEEPSWERGEWKGEGDSTAPWNQEKAISLQICTTSRKSANRLNVPSSSTFKYTLFSKSNTCHIKIKWLSPGLRYIFEIRSMWAILSSTKTNCLWYSVSLSNPNRYCKHTIPLAQYRTKSSVGTQTTDPIDTVGIWISLYIHWGFIIVLMFLVMYFVRVLQQLFSTKNHLVLNMVVHTASLVGLFS
jgi:hypothetical protein